MAKKKVSMPSDYSNPPGSLTDHPFYGLTLDDEQLEFANSIWSPDIDIVFCNAKAGCGKTVVALGVANLLVKYGLFDNIVWLINPTQEQAIGYRPGTTEQKILPYMAPLYDAAMTLGINPYTDITVSTDDLLQEKNGYIECTTPIFLRGRNIPNSPKERTILICDECQNMYVDQIKTVLTRVNSGAKVIMIGHTGQCDLLHSPERSGFQPFIDLFSGRERARVCSLTHNHRSWISQHADTIDEYMHERLMWEVKTKYVDGYQTQIVPC